ncbi:ribonuclease J [Aestuariivirga litoralis]|uniref:ribonuclease J n=1 Tax=Aestuariivirga litoralis TaxID=2650924 RepID=UPI0018C7A6F3|nr:ribonuclease J [Aestuariivirga litoralis]MBG1231831.1 ribonuclease J [Aestuariivirga litoralis]
MNAKRRRDDTSDLVLLPLGGTGEIGMNCYCYGVGPAAARDWMMVDLGVKFGDERDPGIDVIMPDVGFITKNRKRFHGLVITHAHEDHIGAVAHLWPQLECEVHCTPFAAEILKLKLIEHGLDEDVPIIKHKPGSKFNLGPFKLEFIPVTHSIPESCALYIDSGDGTALHSGDWKIDRHPQLGHHIAEERFRQLGEKGVDALICDSTNVLREGLSPSEKDVAAGLEDIIMNAKGRVAVTTFASHVERISCAVRAARAAGREVVIVGRAMRNTIEAARKCGYLKDAGAFLDMEEFGYLPNDRVLLLCTGSQGEARAALARIAEDSHPQIALEKGDLVIFSARTIPGNEKEVGAVINNLAKQDIDVITPDEAMVHSSGHPRQGELKLMYEWVKPKVLVPMHGEPRHLRAHINFARANGIAEAVMLEDLKIVRLKPGAAGIIDEAPGGRLHLDGKLIVDGEDGPARIRRKLSFAGCVFASLLIDEKGELENLEVTTEGVPLGLSGELSDIAGDAFLAMPRARRKDDATVAEAIRNALRRACDQAWGKKPICKVTVFRY